MKILFVMLLNVGLAGCIGTPVEPKASDQDPYSSSNPVAAAVYTAAALSQTTNVKVKYLEKMTGATDTFVRVSVLTNPQCNVNLQSVNVELQDPQAKKVITNFSMKDRPTGELKFNFTAPEKSYLFQAVDPRNSKVLASQKWQKTDEIADVLLQLCQ